MIEFVTEHWVRIAAAVVLIGGWLLLRTRGSQVSPVTALDGRSESGKPVVMEFFSNL